MLGCAGATWYRVGTAQRSLGVMAGLGVEVQPDIKWSVVGSGVIVATVLVIFAGSRSR